MVLTNLHLSVQAISNALDKSGLHSAISDYVLEASDIPDTAAERVLLCAANNYMDRAAAYNPSQLAIAETLELTPMQSPSFWFDICAPTLNSAVRTSMLESALHSISFAQQHIGKLQKLLQHTNTITSHKDGPDLTTIRVRINDAVEKASDPDRLSRLIDGVDMIYRACADLADQPADGLRLMSIDGTDYRTVVFTGHPEVSTATRRIMRTLHLQASSHLQTQDNYSVEQIAAQLPFMHAMDELHRIGALEAGFASDIRDTALAGAIMLLECGAHVHGFSNENPSLRYG